jgi:hypothetical protein
MGVCVDAGRHIDDVDVEPPPVVLVVIITKYERWEVAIRSTRIIGGRTITGHSQWFLLRQEKLDMFQLRVEVNGLAYGCGGLALARKH